MKGKTAAAERLPAKKAPRPKPKSKPKRKGKLGKSSAKASIWDWKTPDESTKLRWAVGLVLGLLIAAAVLSGEIRPHGDAWRAGFRDWRGRWVLGIHWRWGEWPRRWSPP